MATRKISAQAARALAAVKTATQGIKKLRRDAKAAKANAKQVKDEFKAARKHSKQARKALRTAEQHLDQARQTYRAALTQPTRPVAPRKSAAKKRAKSRLPLKLPEGVIAPELRQRVVIARTAAPLVPIPAAANETEHKPTHTGASDTPVATGQ